MTEKQGLYDPAYEHDACGIGFVAHIHGVRSRDVVEKSLELLRNLSHRSAVAADARFTTVVTYDGVPKTVQDRWGASGFLHTDDGALVIGQPDVPPPGSRPTTIRSTRPPSRSGSPRPRAWR